jgi:hypothetical protein
MAGHEIEHFDSAPIAEVLPINARAFADEIGHHFVSGSGDVIIENLPEEPISAFQQTYHANTRKHAEPIETHRYGLPKVMPITRQGGFKPGVAF